jgi:antitoxin component of MazEF toxin-antitoxin module
VTDYKKYALGQVENFLYDAMSTDATPQEIYDTIKGVVEDNYHTYKHQTSNAYELLALLNGNGKGHIKDYDDTELMPHLQCDGNDTSDECKNAWDDFWEQSYQSYLSGITDTPEEAEELRKDKVKKWVLPVEVSGDLEDYVVTFPDDLLEAANLKEGDQIEWHDQGDGSYLLKKFERKTNTYDDMIAAQGYTMTDDGFWIKETK